MTRPHSITFDKKEGMTKQSFRDECNINKIMAKFQRTGLINHYAKHAPQYMDIPAIDYHEALNIVADAESMFEELPSTIRAQFENDPHKFLEFVQDPNNLDKMREMGLAKPSQAPESPPEVSKPKTKGTVAPETTTEEDSN